MKQGIETRLDGETLVVRIPMRFQRRGGRKRIVAPDGGEILLTSKPQPDGTLVKALARACYNAAPMRVAHEASRASLRLAAPRNCGSSPRSRPCGSSGNASAAPAGDTHHVAPRSRCTEPPAASAVRSIHSAWFAAAARTRSPSDAPRASIGGS